MAFLTGGQRLGLTSSISSTTENLSNNYNQKSVAFVKLTDSAGAAIANFIKRQNHLRTNSSQPSNHRTPTIQFSDQTGTICIPTEDGDTTFSFRLSSCDDQNGPQGSFECLGSINKGSVDAVGPIQNKLTVHGSADAYQRFEERINEAKKESSKRSTVLLSRGTSGSRSFSNKAVRRPYQSTLNNKTNASALSSTVPSSFLPSSRNEERFSGHHSGLLSTNHPYLDRYSSSKANNKPANPDIMKKPLRERIAHLLAVRPYKKPELLLRIKRDGILEKDKKNISNIVRQVAHTKDNTYRLARHMWNDVSEDWPFYTEEDKAAFRRSKPQNLTPPGSDGSSSSIGSGLSSSSSRPASPQAIVAGPTLKRKDYASPTYDSDLIPPSKKKRVSKFVRRAEYGSGGSDCGGKSPLLGRSPGGVGVAGSLANNKRSPSCWRSSVSPAQATVTSQYQVNSPANRHRRRLSSSSSTSPRGPNHASRHDSPDREAMAVNLPDDDINEATMQTEDDDRHHKDNDDKLDEDWRKQYSRIENEEQRRLYKQEFTKNYNQYLILYEKCSNAAARISSLKDQLARHPEGTPAWKEIEAKIKREYRRFKSDEVLQERREFVQLHHKMNHIKQLVQAYDDLHYKQRSYRGDRTEKSRVDLVTTR